MNKYPLEQYMIKVFDNNDEANRKLLGTFIDGVPKDMVLEQALNNMVAHALKLYQGQNYEVWKRYV